MLIIGCDYHPGFQQIAFVDTETGECGERRLARRRRSGAVLPRTQKRETPTTCGYGSQRALALSFDVCCANCSLSCADRGHGRDSHQASAQAEDGSAGCTAVVAADDRRTLSADMGSRRSRPGPAATAVASTSVGADAHPGDESVACGGAQRGPAAQERRCGGRRGATNWSR